MTRKFAAACRCPCKAGSCGHGGGGFEQLKVRLCNACRVLFAAAVQSWRVRYLRDTKSSDTSMISSGILMARCYVEPCSVLFRVVLCACGCSTRSLFCNTLSRACVRSSVLAAGEINYSFFVLVDAAHFHLRSTSTALRSPGFRPEHFSLRFLVGRDFRLFR